MIGLKNGQRACLFFTFYSCCNMIHGCWQYRCLNLIYTLRCDPTFGSQIIFWRMKEQMKTYGQCAAIMCPWLWFQWKRSFELNAVSALLWLWQKRNWQSLDLIWPNHIKWLIRDCSEFMTWEGERVDKIHSIWKWYLGWCLLRVGILVGFHWYWYNWHWFVITDILADMIGTPLPI